VVAERFDVRLTTHRSQENLQAVWSEATGIYEQGKAARPVAAERLDVRLTTHRSQENLKAVWSEATDQRCIDL
jgi:hypothetical protein